jgi:hypothetical protein
MPDSEQPPFWGPAYHERDLDALLSGARNPPVALRPVESTLAALRAAPTRRELSDEAAARAAFRALASPQAQWAARAEHATVTQHTLVLPPVDRRRPRTARHRRRRATWEAHRSAIAITGVAAVALIVIAVAMAGAIPGSIGQMMSLGGHPTSAGSPAAKSGRTPVSLEGTGASTPTPSPEVTGTGTATSAAASIATGTATVGPRVTSGPGTLCRELFERSVQQSRTTWLALFAELSRMAGGRYQVFGYCLRNLGSSYSAKAQWPSSMPSLGAFPSGFPSGPAARGNGNPGSGKRGLAGFPG